MFFTKTFTQKKGLSGLLLFALLFLISCAAQPHFTHEQDLQQIYLNAVRDAEIAEPAEISKNLLAIVESDPSLRWREQLEGKQLLVVTWTSWDGYDHQIGKTMNTSREIWVTVVPELLDFCTRQALPEKHKILRLEQLLGLPPDDGKTRFVELWVSPDDLFRPAPDPEITDHEAELDFPKSSQFITVSEEHKQWFNHLKNTSYQENPYPWTRLGYTYDWGNPKSEVGLSEFVIRAGARIDIHSVNRIEDYCK